jgi:hypothetical protein
MITIQASVSKGWLNKLAGFKFTEEYYFDPLFRLQQDHQMDAFIKEKFPHYPIYNMEDNLMQAEYVSSKQLLIGGLQPNLILGSILGGNLLFFEDKDCDIEGKPLEHLQKFEDLPKLLSLLDTPLVKRFTEQISSIKTNYPGYKIIPPFFWDSSGRATIHGITTTSLKLLGENIFILMASEPDLVYSIHEWITDAYIILINHFAKLAEIDITSMHIGECSATMLSPKYFDEFNAPYIAMLGDEFENIRLHSCGKSDNLIDSFSKLPNLKSLDVGSGTSIKKIREKFGDRISISTFPSPELLVEGSSKQNVISWVDELISDNRQGDLKISYHIEPDYAVENCLAINDHLENKYSIKQSRKQ